MKDDGTKIRAQRASFSQEVELLVYETRGNDLFVVEDVVVTPVEPFTASKPTLTISHQAAQELMDQLWQCGLRPSEGTGSAGSMAATERHLKDMQTLTFKLLDKTL